MEYKPLQSMAYDRLLAMLQNQELEFDKIYSETKIAKDFEISRTPVRDALNRLANERYIDILPNRGFQLHKSTPDDVREAYHLRSAIECYCARMLAKDFRSEAAQSCIKRMQEMTRAQEAMSLRAEIDLRAYWDCDYEFHLSMVRHVNVPSFYQQFNTFMHFFMAHYVKNYRALNRDRSTVGEHQQLINAIQLGYANEAVRCIQYHLDQTLEVTLQSIESE